MSFLRRENLPGFFPFTAGVFPFKRDNEDPARMFAGEGDAFRTNRRFHLVAEGQPATRLSTAFDSVTLYGATRMSVLTSTARSVRPVFRSRRIDDMKVLYDGFDLTAPNTSVSMTINGPAPTILAFFLNAVDRAGGCERQGCGVGVGDMFAAPFRPTFSRRTKGRTPASSRPSSACG